MNILMPNSLQPGVTILWELGVDFGEHDYVA
jgi:hypothetical protein